MLKGMIPVGDIFLLHKIYILFLIQTLAKDDSAGRATLPAWKRFLRMKEAYVETLVIK